MKAPTGRAIIPKRSARKKKSEVLTLGGKPLSSGTLPIREYMERAIHENVDEQERVVESVEKMERFSL